MQVNLVSRGLCVWFILLSGCQKDEPSTNAIVDDTVTSDFSLISKLQDGEPVFGMFARPQNAEGGSIAGKNADPDFIFYSLESGPWDISSLEAFRMAMVTASDHNIGHPITLRIPPIRQEPEALDRYISEGLVEGVGGIVFPHVESSREAELAVQALSDRAWPQNAEGDVITIILIEDRIGVEVSEEIVATPGLSVVIPGPGDLRRAYNGDSESVEAAIQRVLAACKDFQVPCGITAGIDDVVERLEQGFKMIIASDLATIGAGREFLRSF